MAPVGISDVSPDLVDRGRQRKVGGRGVDRKPLCIELKL